jgi:hypothetical protein
MSWDLTLGGERCEHCGRSDDDGWTANYTHNMNGALREIWGGKDWWDLSYMTASEALPFVVTAIDALQTDPERYRAHEPGNGWGSVETLLGFLRRVRVALEQRPGDRLRVCG